MTDCRGKLVVGRSGVDVVVAGRYGEGDRTARAGYLPTAKPSLHKEGGRSKLDTWTRLRLNQHRLNRLGIIS